MVRVKLIRKGEGVQAAGSLKGHVQVTGKIKQDLSKIPFNKAFFGDVELVGGSGKKDEQQKMKLKKILF